MSNTYKEKVLAAVRLAVELADKHPDLPAPSPDYNGISYHFFDDDAKDGMAQTRRTLGLGKWDKKYDDNWYRETSSFGDVPIRLIAHRNRVCERVVVGTEEVEIEFKACPKCEQAVIADGNGGMVCSVNGRADYYAAPLKTVKRTDVVDKVDWQCHPVLSSATAQAVSA